MPPAGLPDSWSPRCCPGHGGSPPDGRRANPWPLLVSTFLLVATGYVFGTMYFALVIVGLMLEALLTRHWSGVRRLLLISGYVGCCASPCTCPDPDLAGHLAQRVGLRRTRIPRDGTPTILLTGHPTTVSPTVGLLDEPGLGADQVPFTYVVWFLPLVCWVAFSFPARVAFPGLLGRSARPRNRLDLAPLPDGSDPDAWPGDVRGHPECGAPGRRAPRPGDGPERGGPPGPLRVGLSLVWVTAAASVRRCYAELGVAPAAGGAVVAGESPPRRPAPRRLLMPTVMIAASMGIAVLQPTAMSAGVGGHGTPGELSTTPTSCRGARRRPGRRAESRGARGAPRDRPDGAARKPVGPDGQAGAQRLHDAGVPRLQLPLLHPVQRRCLSRGTRAMLETEPKTGLLGSICIDQHSGAGRPPTPAHGAPPEDWHVAHDGDHVVTWVRDRPLASAGGVAWSSPGTRRPRGLGTRPAPPSSSTGRRPGRQRGAEPDRLAWLSGGRRALGDPLGGHLVRGRSWARTTSAPL